MQYVNFVFENGSSDEPTLYTGPVPEDDAAYLTKAAEHLQPLSDEQYITGPAAILQTLAKYSYALDGRDLYWCIEWQPGLLIVKMSPQKEMQWCALRSPVPDFGGRDPLPDDGDPDNYDADAENPQYNLIFTPWDAQYDEQNREWGSFVPADAKIRQRFDAALEHVNQLASVMESRYSQDTSEWFDLCQQNLQQWCGEGVRITPS